jgi:endonuclease/exonuclease/phosphatase family metal-dependent hydrolase
VEEPLDLFRGNLVAARVRTGSRRFFTAVSVYSPAWPVDAARLSAIDTTEVRMALHPARSVYVADLLLDAIRGGDERPLIVGGDFNLSETFDSWSGGPRGNREYLDRMASCGMVECLRHVTGQLTPTFRNPRGGAVIHQMDHLFVSQDLVVSLIDCRVGDANLVFGKRLSDHLPILADLPD